MDIVWKFSEQEAEYMINTLAQRPFAEVNNLIQRLVAETRKQQEEAKGAKALSVVESTGT